MTTEEQRFHDFGGNAAGAVPCEEHEYEPWEKHMDAIRVLCSSRGLFKGDEMRRNIENLGAEIYTRGYYERWCAAISNLLLEKKVIAVDELGRKMAEVEARWTAARKK